MVYKSKIENKKQISGVPSLSLFLLQKELQKAEEMFLQLIILNVHDTFPKNIVIVTLKSFYT